MSKRRPCTIGIMSGTSLDAVDVVALDAGSPMKAIAHVECAMPEHLKSRLARLCKPLSQTEADAPAEPVDLIELLGDARRDLTDLYAQTVNRLPRELLTAADGIGAHGQTIRHRPERGFSLQLIDGARLAEMTGLAVVTDFRAADLAAGGQGAPLAPLFHQAMLGADDAFRAIVNIGGIANVTILSDQDGSIIAGFDTGPGNRLLDDWCQQHLGEPFDRDGDWAGTGSVDPGLLKTLLDADYLRRPAPKSTGREDFSIEWLKNRLHEYAASNDPVSDADVQATLLEMTVQSICQAVANFDTGPLLVCGGGAFNKRLMNRLSQVHPAGCQPSDAIGIGAQLVEGAAFAWLARQRLANRIVSDPTTTGASGARLLGAVYPAPPAR